MLNRETVCHQYIRSEECLNIHSHPQIFHPSFTQLWALPAAFQTGRKPLSPGEQDSDSVLRLE